jgi:penicillin-binding protein 2
MLFLIFAVRLFYLQIMSDKYLKWAESNAIQSRTLYPSRGVIYDRKGNLLVYNRPSYDLMVITHDIQPFDTLDFCRTLGITIDDYKKRISVIKETKGYSRYVPQVFTTSQLSSNDYSVLQEKLYKFPGFYIRNRTTREYGCVNASNILGYTNQVSQKETEADNYYVPNDFIGKSGVERSYETALRGIKGVEKLYRDAHGRTKGKYADGKEDREPVSGKNITLSIDIGLQALGEKLLSNKPGSIVMIEPSTGEVLCLVTSPSFDPSLLNGKNLGANHAVLERNPQRPLFDRSIKGYYPPGSTFKPSQGLIFLQEGIIDRNKVYSCAVGYPYLGGHPACHVHGSPLSIIPALSTSCNAFFCWGLHEMLDYRSRYQSPQEGLTKWKNYMVAQGYGYPLGIDLPGEGRGFIPNSGYYDKVYKGRWNSSAIVAISIGQNEITATPLQICNLAATIANRGYYITPHIVHEIQDTPLDPQYTTKKPTGIDKDYYSIIVEGMRAAVQYGTCRAMSMYGIEVCGKTGTAQNPHGRDHSACMAFAPMNNPKVAIAVYVENGGFGAQVAVPIAKLMLEKYFYGNVLPGSKNLEILMQNWSTAANSPYYIKKKEDTSDDTTTD